MDDREAGRLWEKNAHAWTILCRQGFDVYRDRVNTPAFFDMLPDVAGLRGLDAGCGEGHNTRLAAARGARMVGVDIAPTFLRYASQAGGDVPYVQASAIRLPFASESFDFAIAVMSLMDLPNHPRALKEISRVLARGGFLQFSISHPCFNPPHRRLLRNPQGEAYAVEVGRYFDRVDGEISRWIFSAAPAEAKAGLQPFEVPLFHRTLSEWLNAVLNAGFALEEIREPCAGEETATQEPRVQDTRVVAYFLHVRCRKT